MFSTWEQGFETSLAESDGATGTLYRKDRVSQSAPDAGHAVTERWGPASGQWRAVNAALDLLTGRRRSDSG